MITRFDGDHYFLSNFYPCTILWSGKRYRTAEHIYQAQKSVDPIERDLIRFAPSPGKAKRLGSRAKLRPDWDDIKDELMYEIVLQKFKQNPDIRKRLLKTGDQILIEGNYWGDTYWGRTEDGGLNKLGLILMKVREELRGK